MPANGAATAIRATQNATTSHGSARRTPGRIRVPLISVLAPMTRAPLLVGVRLTPRLPAGRDRLVTRGTDFRTTARGVRPARLLPGEYGGS
ncbi:hypothetical protein Sfulv_18970 [Streptomyces fulvorobeus]|uniref:Uncharacterized protein n=1 Tax=Streptomyces fulvorobeus TaxID=284028 RepID=A0A7J0C5V5_9ACTN|nr:hypothetical protein Sfulv_18970 [Streptomyces fulvorobeus]